MIQFRESKEAAQVVAGEENQCNCHVPTNDYKGWLFKSDRRFFFFVLPSGQVTSESATDRPVPFGLSWCNAEQMHVTVAIHFRTALDYLGFD